MVALINLALDQADIHIVTISWISVLACIVLCIDALRRTNWAAHPQYGKLRLALGSGGILLAFLSFGVFLSLHKKALPAEPQTAKSRAEPVTREPERKRESSTARTETKAPPSRKATSSKVAEKRELSPKQESPQPKPHSTTNPIVVAPGGAVSFGQQGGITAGQVNLFAADQTPIRFSYSQKPQSGGPPYRSVVTIETSARVEPTSLALIFDAEVSLGSYNLGTCMSCGDGRIDDAGGRPDLKTIWIFWASPPFTPDSPLSVTVSSPTPAKLLRVGRGPGLPR